MKKILVNGSCISYDFLSSYGINDGSIDLSYIYRIPFASLANTGISLDSLISEDQISKIKDLDDLRNFKNYYNSKVGLYEQFSKSDLIIFDLYRETYPQFKIGNDIFIEGPEFGKYGIANPLVPYSDDDTKFDDFKKYFCQLISCPGVDMSKFLLINFSLVWNDAFSKFGLTQFDIEYKNNYINKCVQFIRKTCPQVNVITTGFTQIDLDLFHQWGAGPIHFSSDSWARLAESYKLPI